MHRQTQRERFEKICGSLPFCMPLHTNADGGYRDTDTKRAWAIWQTACPEGWQAVPKEQTDEMREAGRLALMNIQGGYSGSSQWDAQLDAAPKPEDACKSPD